MISEEMNIQSESLLKRPLARRRVTVVRVASIHQYFAYSNSQVPPYSLSAILLKGGALQCNVVALSKRGILFETLLWELSLFAHG